MLTSRRCFLAKEGDRIVQLPKGAGSEGIFVKVDLANEEDVGLLEEKRQEFDYASIGETGSSLDGTVIRYVWSNHVKCN
jgi:hypothetical protein